MSFAYLTAFLGMSTFMNLSNPYYVISGFGHLFASFITVIFKF